LKILEVTGVDEFGSSKFWKKEMERQDKMMRDLLKTVSGGDVLSQIAKQFSTTETLRSVTNAFGGNALGQAAKLLEGIGREQTTLAAIGDLKSKVLEHIGSKPFAEEMNICAKTALETITLHNKSIADAVGIAAGESVLAKVGKSLDLIKQWNLDHTQTALDQMREVFDKSSWVDSAIGNLSTHSITPPMPPIYIRPVQAAQPEPQENAGTFAEKQVRKIERIKAAGKDVILSLITPEGEKLEVSGFSVTDPEYIYISLVGEIIRLHYTEMDEYQFIVEGKEKPQTSGENDEGPEYIN
jgi:hypothetical protein